MRGAVRTSLLAVASVFGLLCLLAPSAQSRTAGQDALADLDKEFLSEVRPILQEFCLKCHGGQVAAAGLDLDSIKGAQDVLDHPEILQKVIQNVRSEVMPPPSQPQPSKLQRETVVSWIQRVYSTDCDVVDPGKVTIRRLNRVEYDNSVRDLLGIEGTFSADFPSDDVGYGFDNIGDVLSLSPLHLEKYLAAAKAASEKAIIVPRPSHQRLELDRAALDGGSVTNYDEMIMFATSGTASWQVTLPATGDGMLTVVVAGMQAGRDLPKLGILVDGALVDEVSISALGDKPQEIKVPFSARSANVRIAVAFTNDYYEPNNADPNRRDRNLMVYRVSVDGPDGTATLPESHRRTLFHYPKSPTDEEAPRNVLTTFASRAYRRPVTPDEIARLMEVYKLVRSRGDGYERAIQVCIQAVLVSPNFLFRVELDDRTVDEATADLDGYELASRLSYFLWSSMPDDALFDAAKSGKLATEEGLREQVTRMLASPKASALSSNFAGQWLQIQRLVEVSPDPTFGAFDDALRRDLEVETEMFFDDMVRKNRPLTDFIDTGRTFLNGRLARHYGVPGISGEQFREVDLREHNRGGLLGMGSVLTVTSNPNRTSPVKRGKWLMEAVLGTPPPPPPPDVGVLADDQRATAEMTIKERLELHRGNPECASCHAPLDGLGFSLENFDAVGRWRTKDGTFDVDPVGELPGWKQIDGLSGLREHLVDRKDDFFRSLTTQMLTYATGRGMTPADGCLIDEAVVRIQEKGGRMQDLIMETVLSDAFRKRRVTEKEAQ